MKKIGLIILIISCTNSITFCQDSTSYILSGTVVNGGNNISLVGANLLSSRRIGTKTDKIGNFNITVFPNDTLKISFIGFKSIKYIAPQKKNGKYLIKFKMYKDSISLAEVEIFPWPTYKEFKKAFLAMNKEKERIKMKGINIYVDKSKTAPKPSIMNPASFIYDKLFDKQAKMRRRIARRRKIIKESKSSEN
ncbi:MAG: carboxypeptidase-like regulatory domain-containing protein [Flavobacteriales bacterium]|nr:carboxypeptidase-like regulatory domain-containing protein [Flavobacteriales bacterium]